MFTLLANHWETWLTIAVFTAAFIGIIFELFDQAIIALTGATVLILTGIMDFEEAIRAVSFEILLLLAAMMIIVEIAKESGFFTWLNFKLAKYSKGNPFFIFLFFTLTTAFFSAFLDNVTTILIVVPITIALVSGMGYNPVPFIITEILFSNIGGALTLIGDPPNILVGTSVGISFNSFITHLSIPIFSIILLTLAVIYAVRWKDLKPIHHHLPKLFMSNLLLKRLEHQFFKTPLDTPYIITVVVILALTTLGFLLQLFIGLPVAVIAGTGALALMLAVHKKIHIHRVFAAVEWPTLGFFAGLFVMVAAMESVGVLESIANVIQGLTTNFASLMMIILWSSGIFSMIINNIPFVTIMIPIIMNIQAHATGEPHTQLLWWALILGAALGGNGTIIGASANVIGVDIARKNGIKITFMSYLRYGLPLTFMALAVSSIYLLAWYYFF